MGGKAVRSASPLIVNESNARYVVRQALHSPEAEADTRDTSARGTLIRSVDVSRGGSIVSTVQERGAEFTPCKNHDPQPHLEYDSERAGGFPPLRYVPEGKTVVLGLISTKVAQLESQEDLLRRIDEAAKYVPVANLALSPQCGFASVAAGNEISWDDQRRKLELLVDTARKVWPR